ncbi:MAG: glycosyltransferase [Planctomycetota bacterium]
MKIAYLTAGAAGMFCGSCMNDNSVARGLMEAGHDCVLAPVYTPIRTDEESVSVDRVFLGGVSVYLQQKVPLFRSLPKSALRWLDQPWLIRGLTKNAGKTSPDLLGPLAVSMLEGVHGHQRAEFERLAEWLQSDIQPDTVLMTNLLIGGAIPELIDRLGVRVYVTLQGDDIFLDSLPSVYRQQAIERMRQLVPSIHGFIVHSQSYADFMAEMLAIPSHKLHIVPLAIRVADFIRQRKGVDPDTGRLLSETVPSQTVASRPITIGYLARMAPEKGLHQLTDAFIALSRNHPERELRLRLAGWMGPQHDAYWEEQKKKLKLAKLDGRWDYAGSVDRSGKVSFLESLDLFCVPTTYADPKGLFLLEATAVGLPYVMPDHGAFPEVHKRLQKFLPSDHGRLYRHDSVHELVRTLEESIAENPRSIPPSSELLHELDIETHTSRLISVLSQ